MMPGETLTTGADPTCNRCRVTVQLEVLQSAAGYYIGTRCHCGPYTRESVYYINRQVAKAALDSNTWQRRAEGRQ